MSPEEWQKLGAVLDELLDLPEEDQARFLQKLRTENPPFCQQVESLLQQQHPTERFEAPPSQWLEALQPTGEGMRDLGTSKLPEIAGYEVLELLGRGGMGVVYKARHVPLNRIVALKMIRPDAQAEADDLHRFRTEAEASAQLHHPNIVQIYEVGQQDGQPYFSLEYVEGGGLDRWLGGAPQPPRPAAEVVVKLARAMHYAHGRGVLHRDLKPANILLSGEGRGADAAGDTLRTSAVPPSVLAAPKITDFGLAKRLHEDSGQTQTGAVLGTPSYMAPEQAAGQKEIGPAADVYALGAILYEMLTGRPPFRGPSAYDTLLQVQQTEPVAPTRLQPKVPRDLETICLKCLQKTPAKRYASAGALADDLGRYLDGRPILARPVGRIERTWRWCRRKPKDAALIAVGLLAVLLGAVAYLWIAGARQAAEQDRRDRQARATAEAERRLADAISLAEQAKRAAVEDPLPWEHAVSAARRVKDFVQANPVEDLTIRRVDQTLADDEAGQQEAANRAAAAKRDAENRARDARMKDKLDELAANQVPFVTIRGAGFILNYRSWHERDYESAFADYGVDLKHPAEAEARIRDSAIRPQLLAALETWIPLREGEQDRRLVANLVDRLSEPDAVRRELRDALVGLDQNTLRRLVKQDLPSFSSSALIYMSLAYINAQDFDDAAALLRKAQQRFPSDYLLNFELAYCLGRLNPPRHDDEIRYYTAAVALQPKNSFPHNSLGNALWQSGRLDEAAAEYRTANGLDPKNPYALGNLGVVLEQQGKLDEAVAACRAALALGSQPDEQAALTHNNLGVALDEEGRADDAVAEYRTAVQLDPRNAGARNGLGWALLHHGEFQEALDCFHMDKMLLGPADPQHASWQSSAQRAERLRLLSGQLDAVVQGMKKPADGAEGLDLAAVCFSRHYPAAAARLFQDAFTAAPARIEKNRFDAARAAAQAGLGKGQDAASATDDQRAGWRTLARDWLRADLNALGLMAKGPNPSDRQAAGRQLRVWQNHVDFAGVRDDAELKKLPADEQTAWRQFWTDVAAAVDSAEKR